MNEEERNQPAETDAMPPEPSAVPAPQGETATPELTEALEDTLSSLSQSIDRMETIVRQLEAGDSDWEEAVRLLTEANELAMNSSQRLEQAVQDVVYGAGEEGPEPVSSPGGPEGE
jgi:exodeoxyribonuclease VII small subunit